MDKAYHQGYIKEECQKFTAFSIPWALNEWIRTPYELTNAPPCFQRYMNEYLGGLRDLKFNCLLKRHLDLWTNL